MNVNQVVLVGHVCKDPLIKRVGDSKVAVFRLAINRSYKKGDKWVDAATFVDCEAWAQKADYVESGIKKGTEVFVRGRLETDEWKAKESGENRSRLKVYVLELQLGKNRKDAATVGATASVSDEDLDGLPF